jgi:Ring finger domain
MNHKPLLSHPLRFCECSICLETIIEDDIVLNCHISHQFHMKCLARTISNDADFKAILCPLCRRDAESIQLWHLNDIANLELLVAWARKEFEIDDMPCH